MKNNIIDSLTCLSLGETGDWGIVLDQFLKLICLAWN